MESVKVGTMGFLMVVTKVVMGSQMVETKGNQMVAQMV